MLFLWRAYSDSIPLEYYLELPINNIPLYLGLPAPKYIIDSRKAGLGPLRKVDTRPAGRNFDVQASIIPLGTARP
jgi:hypothetical protein